MASWAEDARWLVVAVDQATIVDLGGKVKFPRGEVVACGSRFDATTYLAEHGGFGRAIIGVSLTGGDYSTLTGGGRSTLTGGDESKLTGGHSSRLTGGDWSTLTGGHSSTLTGGYESKLIGGYGSKLTGGDESTLTGGNGSKLIFRWRDQHGAQQVLVGVVGRNQLIPGTAYRVSDKGEIVPVAD